MLSCSDTLALSRARALSRSLSLSLSRARALSLTLTLSHTLTLSVTIFEGAFIFGRRDVVSKFTDIVFCFGGQEIRTSNSRGDPMM